MNTNKKIAICGAHGTGKSTICNKIFQKITGLPDNKLKLAMNSQECLGCNIRIINETFGYIKNQLKIQNKNEQSENLTLASYTYQLHQEYLYTLQKKNIICDRSALDTFVYSDYYNEDRKYSDYFKLFKKQALLYVKNSYDKIYLIEPSDRPIDDEIVNQEEQDKIVDECVDFLNLTNLL